MTLLFLRFTGHLLEYHNTYRYLLFYLSFDVCQVYRVHLSLIPCPPKFSRRMFDYYVLLRTLTAGFVLFSTASVHNVYLVVRNLITVVKGNPSGYSLS